MASQKFEYVEFDCECDFPGQNGVQEFVKVLESDEWIKAGPQTSLHVAAATSIGDTAFVHQYALVSFKYRLAMTYGNFKVFMPAHRSDDRYPLVFRPVLNVQLTLKYVCHHDGAVTLLVQKEDTGKKVDEIKSFFVGNTTLGLEGGYNSRMSVGATFLKKADRKKPSAKPALKKPASASNMKKPAAVKQR